MIIDTLVAGTTKARFKEGERDRAWFPPIIKFGDNGSKKMKPDGNGGRGWLGLPPPK